MPKSDIFIPSYAGKKAKTKRSFQAKYSKKKLHKKCFPRLQKKKKS